jgi:hypothetical protein
MERKLPKPNVTDRQHSIHVTEAVESARKPRDIFAPARIADLRRPSDAKQSNRRQVSILDSALGSLALGPVARGSFLPSRRLAGNFSEDGATV